MRDRLPDALDLHLYGGVVMTAAGAWILGGPGPAVLCSGLGVFAIGWQAFRSRV